MVSLRHDRIQLGEERDAKKHADQNRGHRPERARRVARLRRPECRHTVRDRFHTGQRRTAGGERFEDEQDGQRFERFSWQRVGSRRELCLVQPKVTEQPNRDDGVN